MSGQSKPLCRRSRARTRFSFVGCASYTRISGFPQELIFLSEHSCTNKNERLQWDTLSRVKSRIIEFMWSPNAHAGVQFAAVKFLQRVILVQSRGIADPRVS
jgi:hypothetical protein